MEYVNQVTEELALSNASPNALVNQVVTEMAVSVGVNSGNPVTTFPTGLPAAASVQFSHNAITGATDSPYSGQQLTQNWGVTVTSLTVFMPPMPKAVAYILINWLVATATNQAVFAMPAWLTSLLPAGAAPSGLWRANPVSVKWSVKPGLICEVQYDVIEAIGLTS